MDGSIADRHVPNIGAVANSLSPLRVLSAIRIRQDKTVDIIGQPFEVETNHVPIARQDIPWSFLIAFQAKSIAGVAKCHAGEVCRKYPARILWTKQNPGIGQLIRSDGELQVHPGIIAAVGHSTAFGLVNLPRKFTVMILRPYPHAQRDLLQVARAIDPLGFGFGSGQRRKQHAGENRNDGDDDEQFN